jgi:O-antigen/teichoic acid export membrane protein
MKQYLLSNIFTRVLCNVLNFILALIITRYYGAIGKGEFTYILTLITFVGFFSNIFSSNSLIYSYAKNSFKTIYFTSITWIAIVCSLEFVFLRLFIVGSNEYLFHISILTFFQAIFGLLSAVLLANQEIKKYNTLSIIYIISNLLIIVFMIFGINRMGLGSIIIMMYCSSIISILIAIYLSKDIIKTNVIGYNMEEIKLILSHGYKYQLFDFLQFMMLRFSFFLLYQFEGKISLGVFSIGLSLIESIWIVSRSSATLNYIQVANSENNIEQSKQTLKTLKISVLISIILVSIIFLMPTEVYTFIFGSSCKVLKHYIRWLIPGAIAYPIFIVLSSYFLGKGRIDLNIIACGLGAFISIFMGYFLIVRYEMTGTAFTMSISFIVCSLFLLYQFYKNNNFTLSDLLVNKKDIQEFLLLVKKTKS